jgi:hypothetical protein
MEGIVFLRFHNNNRSPDLRNIANKLINENDTGYSMLVGNPAFAGMIKFLYQVFNISDKPESMLLFDQHPVFILIKHFPIIRDYTIDYEN